jgi:hypothetical protein
LSLDLVQLDLALELFFFAMSVLVPKLPSTVKFNPDQCNMTCYPAGCKKCCCCKGVVVVGFSSVLTISRKASGPSQLLLVACVIPGTVMACCGVD